MIARVCSEVKFRRQLLFLIENEGRGFRKMSDLMREPLGKGGGNEKGDLSDSRGPGSLIKNSEVPAASPHGPSAPYGESGTGRKAGRRTGRRKGPLTRLWRKRTRRVPRKNSTSKKKFRTISQQAMSPLRESSNLAVIPSGL